MQSIGPSHVKAFDYTVAQFPPGGQRGFATALLLEHFETATGIATFRLFPNVVTASIGMPIAAATYLPHPENPNAPLMKARQLVEIFPAITSLLPRSPAYIGRNRNDREPLAQALMTFIGEAKLSDLMGNISFSAHQIGALSKSYRLYSKMTDPQTGEVIFHGDPDTKLIDIILGGTALPAIYKSHDGLIDLAFSEVPAKAIIDLKKLHHGQGMFVRVGNFRTVKDNANKHLVDGSYIMQAANASVTGAVSDQAYSQTLEFVQSLFGRDFVYNLENEIPAGAPNPPSTLANMTTPEQFARVRSATQQYIESNKAILAELTDRLGENAIKRQQLSADTAFGLREYPLPELPSTQTTKIRDEDTQAYKAGYAAGRLTQRFGEVAPGLMLQAATHGLRTLREAAYFALHGLTKYDTFGQARERVLNALLPDIHPQDRSKTTSVPDGPKHE